MQIQNSGMVKNTVYTVADMERMAEAAEVTAQGKILIMMMMILNKNCLIILFSFLSYSQY